MLLLILNYLDLILTLLIRDSFTEANPIMAPFISSTWVLLLVKLGIAPILILVLSRWKKNYKWMKIAYIILCVVYSYAVVVGGLELGLILQGH